MSRFDSNGGRIQADLCADTGTSGPQRAAVVGHIGRTFGYIGAVPVRRTLAVQRGILPPLRTVGGGRRFHGLRVGNELRRAVFDILAAESAEVRLVCSGGRVLAGFFPVARRHFGLGDFIVHPFLTVGRHVFFGAAEPFPRLFVMSVPLRQLAAQRQGPRVGGVFGKPCVHIFDGFSRPAVPSIQTGVPEIGFVA